MSFIDKSQPQEPDESHAMVLGGHPNSIAALNNKQFKVPGDTVNKATAELPDNQRSAIRRFHAHYCENDLSLEEAAKLIRFSPTSLSLVFRGKYGGKLDNIVEEIESFFTLEEKRKHSRKLDFIKKDLSNSIWNICDLAREFQRIGFIFGDGQVGKSTALEEYTARNNHGSTIYVSMPTGGARGDFLNRLATKLRIGTQTRYYDLRRRIIESFDDRMLFIIDEGHQAIPQKGVNSPMCIQSIEFIREIFNESKCGVVICATNVFEKAMEDGPLSKILAQTRRRRLCVKHLPNKPSQKDLNTFAAAYGLPPSSGAARDLESEMIDNEALGMWLLLLRMARKLAGNKTMQWAHVLSANAGMKDLEAAK